MKTVSNRYDFSALVMFLTRPRWVQRSLWITLHSLHSFIFTKPFIWSLLTSTVFTLAADKAVVVCGRVPTVCYCCCLWVWPVQQNNLTVLATLNTLTSGTNDPYYFLPSFVFLANSAPEARQQTRARNRPGKWRRTCREVDEGVLNFGLQRWTYSQVLQQVILFFFFQNKPPNLIWLLWVLCWGEKRVLLVHVYCIVNCDKESCLCKCLK